jgi:mono/diheme cytochrome c family protein
MEGVRTKVTAVACALALALIPAIASALPFNDDMVNTQLKTGQVMRGPVKGTLPRGMLAYHLENKKDAENLQNPLKGDALSTANGERLFRVNCFPCHGNISASGQYTPGPVAQPGKFMAPPDITSQVYKDKSDGYIYGTIHFGGLAMMPAYGWKLSPTEHWDIFNYVRKVQATKVTK